MTTANVDCFLVHAKQAFNLHENPKVRLISIHILEMWKLKTWEIQKPKIAQLVSGRTGIQTQAACLQSSCF